MDFGAKIGPLPVWGWAVGVVGAYYVFHYMHGSSSPATTTVAVPSNLSLPGSGATVASSSGGPVGPVASVSGPTTNQQWSTLAANYLIAQGDSPTTVESALADYLAGNTLDSAEQAIVDQALKVFGSPPDGVIGATTGGGTSTTPTSSGPVASGTPIFGTTPVGSSSPTNWQPPPPPVPGKPTKAVYGPVQLYVIQPGDPTTWAGLQAKLLPGLTRPGALQLANPGITKLFPGETIHYQREYKTSA